MKTVSVSLVDLDCRPSRRDGGVPVFGTIIEKVIVCGLLLDSSQSEVIKIITYGQRCFVYKKVLYKSKRRTGIIHEVSNYVCNNSSFSVSV